MSGRIPETCCTECGLPLNKPCSKCAARNKHQLVAVARPPDLQHAYWAMCELLGWSIIEQSPPTLEDLNRAATALQTLGRANNWSPAYRRPR